MHMMALCEVTLCLMAQGKAACAMRHLQYVTKFARACGGR
jgi:hypothetical protein